MREDASLRTTEPPVTRALIMICEKCGKKLSKISGDDDLSRTLQKSLKAAIAEAGEKHEIRAVLSSCLNLCPDDAIALSILPIGAACRAEFLELDPQYRKDAEAGVLRKARKLPLHVPRDRC